MSEDAQAFLKLAAFMEPGDIDPGHIERGAEAIAERDWSPLPSPLSALAGSGVALRVAVAECVRHSLLNESGWENEEAYRMHRTTQLVLRDWMGEDARRQTTGLAGRIGRAQFSDDVQFDIESWPRMRRLAPHARALAGLEIEVGSPDAAPVVSFVHESALFVEHASDDLHLVMRLLEQNLGNVGLAHGADSSQYASALSNLACVQDDLSRRADGDEKARLEQEAEKNHERAIAIDQSAHKLNNFAEFLWARKRFNEALERYSASLRILEESSAGGELLRLSYGNLGVLYSDWSSVTTDDDKRHEYRRLARAYTQKALDVTRDAMGHVCFDTADCHANMAREFIHAGDMEDALSGSIRAAAIALAMLEQGLIDEPAHPTIQRTFAGLQNILMGLGRDPGEAESLARAEIPPGPRRPRSLEAGPTFRIRLKASEGGISAS